MIQKAYWRRLSCIGLAAALWTAVVALAEPSGSGRRPSLRPKAQIPLMAQAPAIDGVLAEGEWPTLHVARWVGGKDDYLSERAGEFWVGSDGKQLYIAARSAVHPGLGAVARMPPRKTNEDAAGKDDDDSLEIWVSREAFGGSGQHQIILTPAGAVWDVHHGGAGAEWTAAMTQAHRVQAGVWVAELAIDLKSVGLEDVTAPFSLRVCRTFQKPKEQCRWASGVVHFSVPTTMPTVFFSAKAPIVSETGFQDAQGIRMGVDLANSGTNPVPVEVRLTCQVGPETPGAVVERTLELGPGATNRVELARPWSDLPAGAGIAFGEIRVKAAKGGLLYQRDVRWRLQPQEHPWEE